MFLKDTLKNMQKQGPKWRDVCNMYHSKKSFSEAIRKRETTQQESRKPEQWFHIKVNTKDEETDRSSISENSYINASEQSTESPLKAAVLSASLIVMSPVTWQMLSRFLSNEVVSFNLVE